MPIGSDPGGWRERGRRLFDPDARAERRRRRARRKVAVRGLLTIGLAYLTSRVGVVPAVELGEVFWAASTAVAGAATFGASREVWRHERSPRPPPVPPLPPMTSAAHAPLRRLAARETALAELCAMLGPVCRDTLAEAGSAAGALRRLAAQVVILEGARPGVPPEARAGLDAALSALHVRLSEGISAYDLLVAAATDAVAAAAEGHLIDHGAVRRLHEAADSLAGLARGLREVPMLPR